MQRLGAGSLVSRGRARLKHKRAGNLYINGTWSGQVGRAVQHTVLFLLSRRCPVGEAEPIVFEGPGTRLFPGSHDIESRNRTDGRHVRGRRRASDESSSSVGIGHVQDRSSRQMVKEQT